MYKKGSENHLSEKENEITTEENEGEGSVLDNILLSFEYNVKNSEEEQAFKAFQKKYVYKSNIIKTCLFGAAALLFLISFIRAPKEYLNPVLMFISLAVIFVIWFNTFKIRKSLLQALKMLENDRYIFTLYDDRFSIETIIDESESFIKCWLESMTTLDEERSITWTITSSRILVKDEEVKRTQRRHTQFDEILTALKFDEKEKNQLSADMQEY